MSDDNQTGNQVPQGAPAPQGFDWLIEAHQETTGSVSAPDTAEPPAPPTLTFAPLPPVAPPPATAPPASEGALAAPPPYAGLPAPAQPASAPPAPSYLTQPPPAAAYVPPQPVQTPQAQPPVAPQPYASQPQAPVVQVPAPTSQEVPAEPTPGISGFGELFATPLDVSPSTGSSAAQTGPRALGLERHEHDTRPTTGALDWIALVLAIILPPIGLLTAIAAVILGARNRGFASGVAKAAIGIGAALTVVVIIAGVVGSNLASQQAKHDAIAASSVAFCTKLKADPGTLQSSTFGWPSPGNTIPDTITSMQAYEDKWTAIEKVAPAGILPGTTRIAKAAQGIITSVSTTQVFDDSSDVATMQQAVANSGIPTWVSEYCS